MKLEIITGKSYSQVEEYFKEFVDSINKNYSTKISIFDIKLFEIEGCITYHIFYGIKDNYGKIHY